MSDTEMLDAATLDATDPLAGFRQQFELPEGIYLVGNSLGALPRAARRTAAAELDRWSRLGVEGHFTGQLAWASYHGLLTDQLAGLVGGRAHEVVAMNSLGVNLHLLMVSFYRPSSRHKILIDDDAVGSDRAAVESQIRQRGFDPRSSLVAVRPRPGEITLRTQDILHAIADLGEELALVLLPGVRHHTGQVLPIEAITRAAHAVGAAAGFDLAHAVGNVELDLHGWGVDFAAWGGEGYLNGGPGAVGGAFVHERHVDDPELPKLLGWWGTNPATRFAMGTDFDPIPTVESWQLSNAPVLATVALRASLDIFDTAGGMAALRRKSLQQFSFLDRRLDEVLGDRVQNLTPRDPDQRGCQSSLRINARDGRTVHDELISAGVRCDWREPDVIAVAPVPLYNSFDEIERFIAVLDEVVG